MGTNRRDNNIDNEHLIDQISAYIDNALGDAEREQVRAHLDTCNTCGPEYRELLATRQMLRALPVQVPPRVFTLTEEMVGARSRPSLLSRLFDKALAPRLATGSVLAFALLLVMLVSDLGLGSRSSAPAVSGLAEIPAAALKAEGEATEDGSVNMSASEATATTAIAADVGAYQPTTEAQRNAVPQSTPLGDVTGGGAGGGTDVPQGTTVPAMPVSAPTPTEEKEPAQQAANAAATPTAVAEDQASAVEAAVTPPVEQRALYAIVPSETPGTDQAGVRGYEYASQPPSSDTSSFPLTLAVEAGLALLGIGLAIGALVARRRGA